MRRGRSASRRSRSSPQEERSRFGEIVFRFCFGSIYHLQHFNADAHPGNYLLMDDGRVAFLDFGMTKQLDREQIELEQRGARRRDRATTPRRCARRCTTSASSRTRRKLDAERLMEHVMAVGGWYMEDREVEITPQRVMKIIESTSDPRSEYYDLMRRENLPADELMGRRMEIGRARRARPAAGEAQLAPDHARVGLRATRRRPSSASRSGSTSRPGASAAFRDWQRA